MRIAVGISGASGTVYGQRLVQVLAAAGVEVYLTLSRTLEKLFPAELGLPCDVNQPDLAALFGAAAVPAIRYRRPDDVAADVASGSFRMDGYVICPASTGLLGRASVGASTNLLERMCDVAMKERRTLVLVPRETPLSTIHIEAMLRLSQAGATILPASPGFYHRPRSLEDAIDFVVQKVCDRLGVEVDLVKRWGGPSTAPGGAGGA
jgi:4-hydroxy-3-polyprenylbenzoate decarboxylase